MTITDFNKKWGGLIQREGLLDDEVNAKFTDNKQEQEYVEDCFSMYEDKGFAPTFNSLFNGIDEGAQYNGMEFEVVRRASAEKLDCEFRHLPMWIIKFKNTDIEFIAYPEEICKR